MQGSRKLSWETSLRTKSRYLHAQYPNPFRCELNAGLTGDDLPKDTRYLWSGIRNYTNLNPLSVLRRLLRVGNAIRS